MAKQKSTFNYNLEIKSLRQRGPGGLYLLYGPEEYLRERFLDELRKLAVGDGDEFNLRRLNGPQLDLQQLSEAVNAMPFFAEGVFVEVRDCELGKIKDAEQTQLKALLSDLPDYCTLAFVQSTQLAPDGRTSLVKAMKKLGHVIEFTEQESRALVGWIGSRCKALGKRIDEADAQYLIFLCGSNMNRLIPEIEKAASHAVGDFVTREDIEATANRLPEADVFAMSDLLAKQRFGEAAGVLRDLLGNKDNHPIFLTSLIGRQMRQLYALRSAIDGKRSRSEAAELAGLGHDFLYDKLAPLARSWSTEELGRLVSLCAEYDYRMKSTGLDPEDLIKELFSRIAAGV